MQTKIYLASVQPLYEKRVFERLYARASNERKEKIGRYRYEQDRLLSLAAEGLLLHAMREAGVPGPAPIYAYGAHNKPYLKHAEGFRFNLSHSGEYAMLVVSDAEVGCDIERIRPFDPRVAKRILSPEEFAAFDAADPLQKDALFCRLWVGRESYLKALGEGLFKSPASFRIEPDSSGRVIDGGRSTPYTVRTGDRILGYRYAVCAENADSRIPTEIVRFDDPEN